VVLLGVLALETEAGRRLRDERPAHARPRRRTLLHGLVEQRDQPVVRDVPRRPDDDVAGGVHRAVIRGDRTAADRRDHLGRSDHRAPERVAAEHRFREEIVHELLRRVLVHRDLLEHDLTLLVELGERGRVHHVRHHAYRLLDVPVGHARVDDRVLPRRRRVELGSHRVKRLGDLLRVVALRSFEEQVLDEVRNSRAVVLLVARAGADPETERDTAHTRHLLGDHTLAGVELREDVLLHRGSLLRAAYATNCRPVPFRLAS
jgi:hypothetical protein